jgi:hypothetical protein
MAEIALGHQRLADSELPLRRDAGDGVEFLVRASGQS